MVKTNPLNDPLYNLIRYITERLITDTRYSLKRIRRWSYPIIAKQRPVSGLQTPLNLNPAGIGFPFSLDSEKEINSGTPFPPSYRVKR